MSSQGQRFRRRALRRGYKVDEVDTFLDRVEATLAGEQIGPPVGAQEVHDVVFRVRFGGYDEWQVDLHLDRVERQLAELEDRNARPPGSDPMRDSLRGGLSAGMGGMSGAGMGNQGMGGPSMGGQGMANQGMANQGMAGQGMAGPSMAGQGMGGPGMSGQGTAGQGMGGPGMGGQGMAGQGMGGPSMGGQGMANPGTGGGRGMTGQGMGGPDMGGQGMANPGMANPGMANPGMANQGMGTAGRMAPPTERLPAPMPQRPQMPQPDQYGRYDEPYGQQQQQQQAPPMPQRGLPPGYDQGGYDQGGYDQGGYDQGGYDQGSYDGFEAGRHGKTDMTAEIRMPQHEQDLRGYGPSPMSGPPMSGPPMGGPPMGNPAMGNPAMGNPAMGGPPMGNPAMGGPPMPSAPTTGGYGPAQPQLPPPVGEPGGELYRIDQLRRTFQPRRFGSGYDPMQVDRLFEGILQAMSGRAPMPVPENELDMLQFGLVSGGYFEAEVDAALREVKDILLRRR